MLGMSRCQGRAYTTSEPGTGILQHHASLERRRNQKYVDLLSFKCSYPLIYANLLLYSL